MILRRIGEMPLLPEIRNEFLAIFDPTNPDWARPHRIESRKNIELICGRGCVRRKRQRQTTTLPSACNGDPSAV